MSARNHAHMHPQANRINLGAIAMSVAHYVIYKSMIASLSLNLSTFSLTTNLTFLLSMPLFLSLLSDILHISEFIVGRDDRCANTLSTSASFPYESYTISNVQISNVGYT